MKVQDIAALITIRSYTYSIIDNVLVKLSPEEVRSLQNKLRMLDKKITAGIIALELDVSAVESPKKKNEVTK